MEMNDEDLKRIFASYRREVADDGFSRRLRDGLPPRPSFMPQVVMCACALAGIVLVFTILGIEPIMHNVSAFVLSVSRMEWPSAVSAATWLGIVCCAGIAGHAVATTE
jgi:hypothetical protein